MRSPFVLEHRFVSELAGLHAEWEPTPATAPRLLALNEPLATELGLDLDAVRSTDGIAVLAGAATPDGSRPVAQAYSGHQFGSFNPRLGDGRAVLLGELVGPDGTLRDVHLKGSGRTKFARGGDGRAAVGPMLREFLISEAMYALGIPTTRALAVVATGDQVVRERLLPGAVLTRVASSHLRVGTFQFAAAHLGPEAVQQLADHAIERHYPHARASERPYFELFRSVVGAQAELISRWMLVGFIHGVMNTDNMTISGETIDFGPCAFMERFDPDTVFSSIDHAGRYAYGNQPAIAQWNLARLAETLLPLIDDDVDRAVESATEVLQQFPATYGEFWLAGVRAKLGLVTAAPDDVELITELFAALQARRLDMTSAFRRLSTVLEGPLPTELDDPAFSRWQERVSSEGRPSSEVARSMNEVNPLYIPRNHLVEEALSAASDNDDLRPFEALLAVVQHPFAEQTGAERFTEPAPVDAGPYQTFCGT